MTESRKRALSVLRVVFAADNGVTVEHIAQHTGFSPAQVQRVLHRLELEGRIAVALETQAQAALRGARIRRVHTYSAILLPSPSHRAA